MLRESLGCGDYCAYYFALNNINIFDTFLDQAWKNPVCFDDTVRNCASKDMLPTPDGDCPAQILEVKHALWTRETFVKV